MMEEIVPEIRWLRCTDGETIAASLFQRPHLRRDAPVLIVNGAMGNRQIRYAAAARWWAARGWRVVTYDYRGIGLSAPWHGGSRHFRLWEWGSQDMTAVVAWVRHAFAPEATVVLGHSVGAQIVQYCARPDAIDAVVFVAGQKGFWRHWRNAYGYALCALWHVVLPACVGMCGSFPLTRLAGCDTLPAKVALDWARWGRSRPFTAGIDSSGSRWRCPLLSISLADDPVYAPPEAVDALLHAYPNARSERLHLVPEAHGMARIGHSGLFDQALFDRFWPLVTAWLERRLATTPSARSA